MASLKEMLAKQKLVAESTTDRSNARSSTEPTQQAASPKASVAPVPQLAKRFGAKQAISAPTHTDLMVSPESIAEMDLSDLANLDVTNTPISQPTRKVSQFDDETPAIKPTREFPADADKSLLQFIDLIDGVYEILGDPELLGNVIRSIMIELKTYPQYMKMVAKDDVRQWVRAMRDSMGLAKIKKAEKSQGRKPGASKGSSKAVDADMLQAFNDLGVDF